MKLSPRTGVALFTDGSAYYGDGSGGWAWCAIDEFGNEEVGSGYVAGTTVGAMELRAWVEGLDHLFEHYGALRVLVYSDAQYVVYGAADRSRARHKNRMLWLEVDRAIDQHVYVEPIWVRGHHNSHYNHLVDQLAGNARKQGRDSDLQD